MVAATATKSSSSVAKLTAAQRHKRVKVNSKRGARNLFEIAEDFYFIDKDVKYLDSKWGGKPDARDKELSEIADNTGFSLYDLIQMYNYAPTREQWDSHRTMRELCNKANLASRSAAINSRKSTDVDDDAKSSDSAKSSNSTKPRNNAIPHKEHEEVTARLESQVQSLANRSESLSEENARLRCENADLRQENAELRGRVKELERIVSRELQNA